MRPLRGLALGVGALLALAALPLSGALANSGSLRVADAGGGSMTVTVSATVDSCSGAYCGWFAAVRERHSTLPCADDRVFRPVTLNFQAKSGAVEESRTFRPFFPRVSKLCLYAKSPFGLTDLLAELTYRVPSGYGFVRSKARRCEDFESQAAAQYYLYLYPDDPSGLDPDRNSLACEQNPCPCDVESIPAEPLETPASRDQCTKARAHKRQATRAVKVAQRRLRKASRPAAARQWDRKLKKRKAALRKVKRRVRIACQPPPYS